MHFQTTCIINDTLFALELSQGDFEQLQAAVETVRHITEATGHDAALNLGVSASVTRFDTSETVKAVATAAVRAGVITLYAPDAVFRGGVKMGLVPLYRTGQRFRFGATPIEHARIEVLDYFSTAFAYAPGDEVLAAVRSNPDITAIIDDTYDVPATDDGETPEFKPFCAQEIVQLVKQHTKLSVFPTDTELMRQLDEHFNYIEYTLTEDVQAAGTESRVLKVKRSDLAKKVHAKAMQSGFIGDAELIAALVDLNDSPDTTTSNCEFELRHVTCVFDRKVD